MEFHETEVVHRSMSVVERGRRDTGKSSVRVPVMVLGAPVEAPQPYVSRVPAALLYVVELYAVSRVVSYFLQRRPFAVYTVG